VTGIPNWDTEDVDEIVGSRLSWFNCPILPPGEMLATIKRCGRLDGRSLNLFAALERPPRSDLFDLYLRENLYQPGSHYVYVTPDAVEYGYKDYRPVMTKGGAPTSRRLLGDPGDSPDRDRAAGGGDRARRRVDAFMDMGRTAVNVLGNTVATKLVTRFGGRAAMDEELPEAAAAAQ
jgi:hypothetical protein